MASNQSLVTLTVSFPDESLPVQQYTLANDGSGCFSVATKVVLPGGSSIEVSAEVFDPSSQTPDVSITVEEQNEPICSLRCSSGVVLSYLSRSGSECFLQLGSGPWE
jgi:hypothetical protein